MSTPTTPTPPNFSSVKLPAALVQQAKEAAGPLCRSTAGQIEYWATLGRVVEHSGLSAQESRAAIENCEAAARKAHLTGTLDDIEARFAAADQSGSLAARVRKVVLANRAKAKGARRAA